MMGMIALAITPRRNEKVTTTKQILFWHKNLYLTSETISVHKTVSGINDKFII